ncbi:MAG: hypothetical protein QGH25_04530, partial [Candidatus Latescibacteria bacterium]|nr:hypothetical protein [Candidatus Latescibacterota bacterium]
MTENTYTFHGPGERWAEQEPTAVDLLNVARENCDHLHEALNSFMDTDDYSTNAFTLPPGSAVKQTTKVQTAQNAQKIIFVNLDDPNQMWDLKSFLNFARATSWYQELGAPPTHGTIWAANGGNPFKWWNLETDAQYISFTEGSNQFLSAAGIASVVFLDGIVYAADNGATWGFFVMDFLRDQLSYWDTTGQHVFQGDISDRNTNMGALAPVYRSSPALINANCNSIAAVRDPSERDEFGRPKHWWAVGTDGGVSVYNPIDDAIYDSSYTDDCDALAIGPSGEFVYHTDQGASADRAAFMHSIFTIGADAFTEDATYMAGSTDGTSLPLGSGTFFSSLAILPGRSAASAGAPLIILGTDLGMMLIHTK